MYILSLELKEGKSQLRSYNKVVLSLGYTLSLQLNFLSYIPQVFAVTNGLSPLSSWNWDHLTLVMAGNTSDTSIMCETKAKGKKYGFIGKMKGPTLIPSFVPYWFKQCFIRAIACRGQLPPEF